MAANEGAVSKFASPDVVPEDVPYDSRDSQISLVGNISESACDKLIDVLGKESGSITTGSSLVRDLTNSSSGTNDTKEHYKSLEQKIIDRGPSSLTDSGTSPQKLTNSGTSATMDSVSTSDLLKDFEAHMEPFVNGTTNATLNLPSRPERYHRSLTNSSIRSSGAMSIDMLSASITDMSIDQTLLDTALKEVDYQVPSVPPIQEMDLPAPRSMKEMTEDEDPDSLRDLKPVLKSLESNVSQLEDF